jgi:hypothetical protein
VKKKNIEIQSLYCTPSIVKIIVRRVFAWSSTIISLESFPEVTQNFRIQSETLCYLISVNNTFFIFGSCNILKITRRVHAVKFSSAISPDQPWWWRQRQPPKRCIKTPFSHGWSPEKTSFIFSYSWLRLEESIISFLRNELEHDNFPFSENEVKSCFTHLVMLRTTDPHLSARQRAAVTTPEVLTRFWSWYMNRNRSDKEVTSIVMRDPSDRTCPEWLFVLIWQGLMNFETPYKIYCLPAGNIVLP